MSSNPATSPSQPDDALSRTLERTELQRGRSSIPGRVIVQVLTEIQAGAESGWHMHPGEEVGYVVAGTVELMVDGQPTLILRAGDPFLVPPRTPHNALDVGPATGRTLSTYIVDRWEPLAWYTRGPGRARAVVEGQPPGAPNDMERSRRRHENSIPATIRWRGNDRSHRAGPHGPPTRRAQPLHAPPASPDDPRLP